MSYFYEQGSLKIGTPELFMDVGELLKDSEGPVYLYDIDNVCLRYQALDQAFGSHRHKIHYAVKANNNPELLKSLAALGTGVDTVSGGEIRLALAAGFTPETIILSGVAKTVTEIEFAVSTEIKQINVESPQELQRIGEVARRLGRTARVAFRLNPDVNPKTHPYITTGFRENKFGMDESFIPELLEILKRFGSHLDLQGLTMHIGSQIFELDVIGEAIEKTIAVHRALQAQGFRLPRLDIGGGLGIQYETADETSEFTVMKTYGDLACRLLKDLDVEILSEPGRILVARAGLLIGEVQYIKNSPDRRFAILNTGMHHLIRPALYGAKHRVLPLRRRPAPEQTYDIVGPICESSDFLAKGVTLPTLQAGDLVAIADSGAYGYTMASRYNAQDLPQEIALSVLNSQR